MRTKSIARMNGFDSGLRLMESFHEEITVYCTANISKTAILPLDNNPPLPTGHSTFSAMKSSIYSVNYRASLPPGAFQVSICEVHSIRSCVGKYSRSGINRSCRVTQTRRIVKFDIISKYIQRWPSALSSRKITE